MARAIDGDELLGIERLLDTDVVRKSKTASWLLDQVLHDIQAMPTLKAPNEPLTLEQLREMDKITPALTAGNGGSKSAIRNTAVKPSTSPPPTLRR